MLGAGSLAQGRAMSPSRQRQLNVERFERLLDQERDPEQRSRIASLLAEEREKPDSAYPGHSLAEPPSSGGRPNASNRGLGA